MEIIGEPGKHRLLDIGDTAYEMHLLYSHIHNGFEELGDGVESVDETEMFQYVIKNSKGRFNPVVIREVLKEFRT